MTLAGTSILTNIILAIFQGNLLGEGLLVWLLAVVLGGMAILLGVQMAVRLALPWVLLVLAGSVRTENTEHVLACMELLTSRWFEL